MQVDLIFMSYINHSVFVSVDMYKYTVYLMVKPSYLRLAALNAFAFQNERENDSIGIY